MQLPDVLPGDPHRGDDNDGKMPHRGRGPGSTQVKKEPPDPQVCAFSVCLPYLAVVTADCR